MTSYKKFEKSARMRRRLALWMAILLHLAAIAAISSSSETVELLAQIVKNWFQPVTSTPDQHVTVP